MVGDFPTFYSCGGKLRISDFPIWQVLAIFNEFQCNVLNIVKSADSGTQPVYPNKLSILTVLQGLLRIQCMSYVHEY